MMESFDEIRSRHSKEQKDLQARITQKKKNATKKTRKGVNAECEELERQLKERQEEERRSLNGEATQEEDSRTQDETFDGEPLVAQPNGVDEITESLGRHLCP